MKVEDVVWKCLEQAVDRFNDSAERDALLCACDDEVAEPSLRAVAGERTITHRLAVYLEAELRNARLVSDDGPLVVDCEYNRHGGKPKTLAAEAEWDIRQIVHKARSRALQENADGFYTFSVAPDIVVHQRRTDANNLLVVEVKRASNPESPEYDGLKLELFTRPKQDERGYGYKLGAWVMIEDTTTLAEDRRLHVAMQFRNGSGMDFSAKMRSST